MYCRPAISYKHFVHHVAWTPHPNPFRAMLRCGNAACRVTGTPVLGEHKVSGKHTGFRTRLAWIPISALMFSMFATWANTLKSRSFYFLI